MTVEDGQSHVISSEFMYSSRPMKTFELLGNANATVYLKDISGNVLGNLTPGNQIIFDSPQPGYAVDVVLDPFFSPVIVIVSSILPVFISIPDNCEISPS